MSDAEQLAPLLDAEFHFRRQPEAIPASLRTDRRVVLLVLLVAKCHGAGASWKGLQLLSWAVSSAVHADLLVSFAENRDIPDRPIVRIDPALDRAIDLAVGLGLLEKKSARVFRLTDEGRALVSAVDKSDALRVERDRLARFKGKVTQTEVDRLLEWREG
jgi:hypothetical protein